MTDYPKTRNASPQAWRRFRKGIGPGEAKNLAADIEAIIEAEADWKASPETRSVRVKSIEFALTGYAWETKVQS